MATKQTTKITPRTSNGSSARCRAMCRVSVEDKKSTAAGIAAGGGLLLDDLLPVGQAGGEEAQRHRRDPSDLMAGMLGPLGAAEASADAR